MSEPLQTLAINVTVNGKAYQRNVEPRQLLVEFIREELRLTGTHIGCDTSYCGACTVLLDGAAIKSCTLFAVQADGAEDHHRRGTGKRGADTSPTTGIFRTTRPAMRVLHPGDAHVFGSVARRKPKSGNTGHQQSPVGKRLPLYRLPEHHQIRTGSSHGVTGGLDHGNEIFR